MFDVTIGEAGRTMSYQKPFPKTTKCVHTCLGQAQLAFVAFETIKGRDRQQFVCELHENDPKGKGYWPHDCCAVAVYFCRKCLKPTARFNQA